MNQPQNVLKISVITNTKPQIRIINNLLLYGFPVIMPLYLCTTHNGGMMTGNP